MSEKIAICSEHRVYFHTDCSICKLRAHIKQLEYSQAVAVAKEKLDADMKQHRNEIERMGDPADINLRRLEAAAKEKP